MNYVAGTYLIYHESRSNRLFQDAIMKINMGMRYNFCCRLHGRIGFRSIILCVRVAFRSILVSPRTWFRDRPDVAGTHGPQQLDSPFSMGPNENRVG